MFVSIHFGFLTLLIILIFVHRRKDTQDSFPVTQRSFFSTADSDTTLPLSRSLSYEMPLGDNLSSPQFSGVTISTIGQKSPKTTGAGHSRSEYSLGKQNIYQIF